MYYPDVPALEPEELDLLCHEYLEHNAHLDPALADRLGVKRGLRNPDGTGMLAGLTNVCDVVGYDMKDGKRVPMEGKLIYRGIDVERIVQAAYEEDRFMFEEVIWLLLFGSLPTKSQLVRFGHTLEQFRELPENFVEPGERSQRKLCGSCRLGLPTDASRRRFAA